MKLGVIGGNGVAATNRLCDMIERKVTAAGAFRDAHHPEMVVWQATSAPSRSMFLEGRGADWRPDYIRIAKQFKDLGCDLGCMCCNTAHYAVNEIVRESELPFINLLEEVAMAAKRAGQSRYELFCSDGARKFDIYGEVFKRCCPEVELIYPSEERQRRVTQVICGVKTRARLVAANEPLKQLIQLIEEAEASVILGCTDLRVAFDCGQAMPACVAVDSLETLANAIVSRCDKIGNL